MDALEFIKKFQKMCTSYEGCIHCPFITRECLINSPLNMTENEIIQFINIVEKWDKEHSVEIDWSKVPEDTPVYVRQNKTEKELCRYFAKYSPNDEKPFQCYSDGRTSWTANGFTTSWVHCELAREEDAKKYAKLKEK